MLAKQVRELSRASSIIQQICASHIDGAQSILVSEDIMNDNTLSNLIELGYQCFGPRDNDSYWEIFW